MREQSLLSSLSSHSNGSMIVDDERMLLTSSSVFGTLRKDLIDNIGMKRVKGFLIRYGWNLGVNDAKKVLAQNLPTITDSLKQGPVLHMYKGYTKAITKKLSIEKDSENRVTNVTVEGQWHHSYEAEEHERQFGLVDSTVCHTLTGYASGYYSTICGHRVIFKELSCKGTGEEYCRYIGKSLSLWGEEIDDELKYYENSTIVEELERTYEVLLQERNNLTRASEINQKLTQELLNGSDLQTIVDAVFEMTKMPLIIEDVHFREYVYTGLLPEQLTKIQSDFQCWLNQSTFVTNARARKIITTSHNRLLIPVMLQKKVVGYCSFIYQEKIASFPDIDYMILERIASIASLYLLNEKTRFESMERMKGHFFEQLLNGQISSKAEIVKKGRYININLELPFYIVILKSQYLENDLNKEFLFQEELLEMVSTYFSKKNMKIMIGHRDGYTVLFLQTNETNVTLEGICKQLLSSLTSLFKGISFSIGMSSIVNDVLEVPAYYEKALCALNMTNYYDRIASFDRLGVLPLLLHGQNDRAVLQKAKQLLQPLFDQNKELLKTLYIFLQNGGNLERTMEELSISKTGLRYRIQKIESLLGEDVRHPDVSYQLRLTLQVLILKGEIVIE